MDQQTVNFVICFFFARHPPSSGDGNDWFKAVDERQNNPVSAKVSRGGSLPSDQ
jgi:hypothetical protein